MPINPMYLHYSMCCPVSIYDEEATTALKLAGKTAKKVNELVEGFNTLETETNKHLAEQDADIPVQVANKVQEYVDGGQFDQAIDEYAGELEARLDNLVSKVPVGSTTMDAEVIDGRVGEDGKTYTNLGQAIREQFGHTLRAVNHTLTDANQMTAPGFYFKGGGDNWTNIPETMTSAGVIITLAPDPVKYPSRVIQMAIDYSGIISVRNNTGTAMREWIPYNPTETGMPRVNTNTADHFDMDDLVNSGYYHFGSGHTLDNAPTDLGMLIVYKGRLDHQVYQMWVDYHTGGMYVRTYELNVGFRPWNKLLAPGDIPTVVGGSGGLPYTVSKVSDKLFYIYKKGSNGYIRYGVAHDVKPTINLDTYRLETITHVDDRFQKINTISSAGADVEGVLLESGASDHVGGVHGDEVASDHYIFIDGKQYTMETIPDMVCSEIRLVVKSTLYRMDTTTPLVNRTKQVTFDRDGVHIHNLWEPQATFACESLRAGMFSIEKENITHYYDTGFEMTPKAVEPMTETTKKLYSFNDPREIIYVGGVSAHHWFEYNDHNIDSGMEPATMSAFVNDYGYRLKSYYTIWNNATVGPLNNHHTTNHFQIEC